MSLLDDLLCELVGKEGSDLHLLDTHPAKIRIHGHLEKTGEVINDVESMVFPIIEDNRRKDYDENGEADFAYEVANAGRFRVNFLHHHNGSGAVFRLIPTDIPTLEELKIPKEVKKFTEYSHGLILVTGPTGSGKSTTLASVLEIINEDKKLHIVTIEDPIEFVHFDKNCIFTQREVGMDTDSFADALASASKQAPDLVLVGEMRDLETIELALTLAEMGMLVFSTLHTNSASHTIDRIIEVFPKERQSQIRTVLATSLMGVLSQILCRSREGDGRVVATELLFTSTALRSVIQDGSSHKIDSIIQTGRKEGMHCMDDSLMNLANSKQIRGLEAYRKANNKSMFQRFVN